MGRRILIAIRTAGLVWVALALLLSVEGGGLVQAAEPIKVGAVLSVTGYAGLIGTPQMEAIQVFAEKVNREGGVLGRPVEVYFEDDQSNPANSVIVASKLIHDKKVCAIIGSTLTNMCMAMLPIFERERVPNVSFGAGHEITDPLRKWVFRITLTDIRLSPVMLRFAAEKLGARKIALLHSTDASGMMGAKGVKENVAKYGMEIVITEMFDPKDTNMVPQLTKIKTARPDAIILYSNAAPAAVVAKNCQQLGMEQIPIIGSHGIPGPEFIKLVGSTVERGRWIFLSLKSAIADKLPANDPYRQNLYDPFIKGFREKFGAAKRFGPAHGNGYDGFLAVISALKTAGTDDRASLRDAMEKTGFEGFNGPFNYSPTDHDGQDVTRSRIPVIIKGGEFWPYK